MPRQKRISLVLITIPSVLGWLHEDFGRAHPPRVIGLTVITASLAANISRDLGPQFASDLTGSEILWQDEIIIAS